MVLQTDRVGFNSRALHRTAPQACRLAGGSKELGPVKAGGADWVVLWENAGLQILRAGFDPSAARAKVAGALKTRRHSQAVTPETARPANWRAQ